MATTSTPTTLFERVAFVTVVERPEIVIQHDRRTEIYTMFTSWELTEKESLHLTASTITFYFPSVTNPTIETVHTFTTTKSSNFSTPSTSNRQTLHSWVSSLGTTSLSGFGPCQRTEDECSSAHKVLLEDSLVRVLGLSRPSWYR